VERRQLWLENALSAAVEAPQGVFELHARNDAILGMVIAGTMLGAVVAPRRAASAP